MLAVHYYYRFKVSLDDVVELMAMRGFHLSHQTVQNWVHRFGPELGMKLRKRRYKQAGDKWHVDATYLRVEGRWVYFYRAIDKEGNLIDVYLSDVRDQKRDLLKCPIDCNFVLQPAPLSHFLLIP
jgi:transposase-like protein